MSDIPKSGLSIEIGEHRIQPADVQLIVAETGVSLSGGEMLIWKRNIVIAANRRYVSANPPVINAVNLKQWLDVCPHAVGILPDGSVKLPQLADDDARDPLIVMESALAVAKKELGSQVFKSLWSALLLGVLGVAIIILVIAYNTQHAQNPGFVKTGFLGIALLIAAGLMTFRSFKLLGRRNRIVRVLRELTSKGEIRTDLLAQTLVPSTAPVGVIAQSMPNPANATPLVPTVLAILSVFLMFCPFIGLVLSIIALGMNVSRGGWRRTLTIVGAIVGALSTAFALIMAKWG